MVMRLGLASEETQVRFLSLPQGAAPSEVGGAVPIFSVVQLTTLCRIYNATI